jgi:hypothetical protein
MTAPLTGMADAPDVAARPMPATTEPTIKTFRIVISPSITTAPNAVFLLHSFSKSISALDAIYLQIAIAGYNNSYNFGFSTLRSFICCSFTCHFF